MCGIFGIIGSDEKHAIPLSAIVKDVFILSESRGKQAAGIALVHDTEIKILKTNQKSSLFVRSNTYKQLINTYITRNNNHFTILGHTRLSTNGIETNNDNNHPVLTKDCIGIHNGMIVNEEDIFRRFPQIKRKNEVDTAILLRLFEHFIQNKYSVSEALRRTYANIDGAASLTLIHRKFNTIVLATNTGSLYYSFITPSLFIFASESYFLQKIQQNYFPGYTAEILQLKANFGLLINRKTLQLDSFSLTKKGKTNPKKYQSINRATLKIIDVSPHLFHNKRTTKNALGLLKQHTINTEAIAKMKRCTRCILPETMPLISFDKAGVCNFCRTAKPIHYVGVKTLKDSIFQTQLHDKRCLVPLSGGRDSSYGLHYIKNVLQLTPIAYTYDWGMVTDIARRNQYRLTAAMGVEHIIVSADINKKRKNIQKNVLAWLHKPNIAMIPLFMAGDKQAEYYAEQTRKRTNTNLTIYCRGNELEDERFKFGYYGIFDGTPGGVLHNLSPLGKMQMAGYYAREFLLNPRYINQSIIDTSFAYFSSYLMSHAFHYLWHYIKWDENEIISTLKDTYHWESPSDTIATWRVDDGTPPFYNYIYYQIQGFTEHDALRSNQIRQGVMTRKKALELVTLENKPRYEALQWYFDAIDINGDRALTIIDQMPKRYAI